MTRRELIALLGNTPAALWSRNARAQSAERVRHVGVLVGLADTNPFTQNYARFLREALQELGWTHGRNIQSTYSYAAGDPALARTLAKELVQMQPDIIVGHTTPVIAALSQATRTIPVVFVSIPDPVLNGFVQSM